MDPRSSHRKRKAGFTLLEVMVASTISVMVIAGVTAAFVESLKVWQQEEIRNELGFNLEVAMERIRADLRLSSVGVGLMSFYPATSAQYTAISIPLSVDTNNDGFLDRDTDNMIVWNETVIYHVRPGTPDKFLRTTFFPRCSTASPDRIYQQLADVVAITDTGDLQNAAIGSEVCSSRIVFENLVNLIFRSPDNRYDCYAATAQKALTHNFGSLVLGDGPHQIELTVTGQNANSSGYYIPIDKVQLSASAGDLDAELFYPINTHPASPCLQYAVTGGAVTNFEADSDWSGRAGLMFAATDVGQKLTLSVSNDFWCDNNFEVPEMASNCQVVVVDTNFFPGDFDVQMQKGETWSAGRIGSRVNTVRLDAPTAITNLLLCSVNDGNAPIMLNGCWVRFVFERGSNTTLLVTNAQIMLCTDLANMIGDVANASNITFGGSNFVYLPASGPLQTTSDWVTAFVVDKTTNYLVRFQTGGGGSGDDADFDMFVGEGVGGGLTGIQYFQNTGSRTAPVFGAMGAHQYWGIAPSFSPSIAFGDVDADGDYDMVLCDFGGPRLYRNAGNAASASMALDGTGALPLTCGHKACRGALVDIDSDGDLDFVGTHQGTFLGSAPSMWIQLNNGTPAAPSWGNTMPAFNTAAGQAIPLSTVEFCDIDRDGDFDLFGGSWTNNYILFYVNSNRFGSTGFYPVSGSVYSSLTNDTGYLHPRFCDIDGDGDFDLFVGNTNGYIWAYTNIGTPTSAVWSTPDTNYSGILVTGWASPSFCNIDAADSGEVAANGLARWMSSTNTTYSRSLLVESGSRSERTPHPNKFTCGLASVEVGYPRFASFRSKVFDTQMGIPVYSKLNYTQFEDQDNGGNIQVRLRTGNNTDLSSATWSDWFDDNINQSLADLLHKRFVQYEAQFECGYNDVTAAHTNSATAALRDVTIDWPAARGLVDLQVDFGQAPNGGIVSATVDGQTLVKGIQVEMEIYKAGGTGSNTASGVLEVRPLNTGR